MRLSIVLVVAFVSAALSAPLANPNPLPEAIEYTALPTSVSIPASPQSTNKQGHQYP